MTAVAWLVAVGAIAGFAVAEYASLDAGPLRALIFRFAVGLPPLIALALLVEVHGASAWPFFALVAATAVTPWAVRRAVGRTKNGPRSSWLPPEPAAQ